ncbi:MAG: hypothetical protein ACREQ9_03995 [Candidatus Binatia bacterium]
MLRERLCLLFALGTPSCALTSILPSPALFGGNVTVEGTNFDRDTLNQTPAGFETRTGQWAVAESPTAASGEQVVVKSGEASARLAVKSTVRSQAVGGEVSVRVFIGETGAGLACEGAEQAPGYVLKLEPHNERLALYRELQDSTPVATASVPIAKGEWRRVGLRCENRRVIGYLDGKPVVRDRASLGPVDLTLYGDPAVTAQFDDLKYWTKK